MHHEVQDWRLEIHANTGNNYLCISTSCTRKKNNNKIDFGVLFTELNSDKLHRVKQTEDKG